MTLLPSADVFQSIEINAVNLGIPELELFEMKLADVRMRLGLRYGNVFEANAWWRGLIEESRRSPDPWQSAALWAFVPRLRNMMWEIYRSTGLGLDECRSELLLGALEALTSIEFGTKDIGKSFITLAAKSAWKLGRGNARAMSELGWTGDELQLMLDEMPPPSKKIEQIIDARKYFLTPKQLTGERFGAIAAKLRMLESLHRPESEGRGASPGSTPFNFIKLFGLPPFVDLKTAARIYGITLKTAYLWIKHNRQPFAVFRDDRFYRVPTTSLAASMGISLESIDFDDVLSGAYFAEQYYESLDDDDPFADI